MKYLQLGDICDVIKGEISITKAIPGEYPLVTTAENRKSHNKFQLDTKAVLVPLVSATGHGHASIKRIHYQEGKFAFGSILAACVPKDENYCAKFLYIYFNLMKDLVLVPLMKGSANVSLTLGNLKKAKIPIISLKKQLEIVDLYSTIKIEQDKVIKKLLENESDIKSLKQAILQEAVQGKLTADWRASNPDIEDSSQLLKRIQEEKAQLIKGKKIKKEKALPLITKEEIPYELPERWVWCRLGNYVHYGALSKYENKDASMDTWVLELEDIEKGSSKLLKKVRFSDREFKSTKSVFKVSDVIYGKLRPYLDKVIIAKEDGVCTTEMIPIKSFGGCNPEYLRWYLKHPDFIEYANSSTHGMRMPRMGTDFAKKALVSIPPIEEQNAIVEKVNALIGICDILEQEVQQSQKHSELLMQSVLREVFEPKKDILKELIPDLDKYAQVAMATFKMENTFGFKHGKVEKQKTGFLLQAIKKQPIPYTFEKQNFGTFSWDLSEDLDKNPYLRKVKAGKGESYEVKSTKYNEVLSLLNAPENASYVQAIDELIQVYQMPQIKGQTEEIELLNTVCKSILDTQSTNLEIIYADMEFWTIKQDGFNSKAEKFSRKRTEKMLEFVLKLGWDKELIT